MHGTWQIQEAEDSLAEIVKQAVEEGPQTITQQDAGIAVVISLNDYRKLLEPKSDLVSFFRNSPLVGAIELSRDTSSEYRDIEL